MLLLQSDSSKMSFGCFAYQERAKMGFSINVLSHNKHNQSKEAILYNDV